MRILFDTTSYDCSEVITKCYSTSFSRAILMMPSELRTDIFNIYGFVRWADEIVDTLHNQNKEELLNEFEAELDKALHRKLSLNPVLHSFQHTVHKHQIPHELIVAFLASMRKDLEKSTYDSAAELEEYIYGSADVVGLMCLMVFVKGDTKTYEELAPYAKSLGSAFQKVNFLRDIKADQEELNRQYYPELNGNILDENRKSEIIKDIEADFDHALVGILKLPKEARFSVYVAYVYYRKLLSKLKKASLADVLKKRIRISNPRKISLLTQSFFKYKLGLLN